MFLKYKSKQKIFFLFFWLKRLFKNMTQLKEDQTLGKRIFSFTTKPAQKL